MKRKQGLLVLVICMIWLLCACSKESEESKFISQVLSTEQITVSQELRQAFHQYAQENTWDMLPVMDANGTELLKENGIVYVLADYENNTGKIAMKEKDVEKALKKQFPFWANVQDVILHQEEDSCEGYQYENGNYTLLANRNENNGKKYYVLTDLKVESVEDGAEIQLYYKQYDLIDSEDTDDASTQIWVMAKDSGKEFYQVADELLASGEMTQLPNDMLHKIVLWVDKKKVAVVKEHKTITELYYVLVESCANGQYVLRDKETGMPVSDKKYDWIVCEKYPSEEYSWKYMKYRLNGYWGLMDAHGNEIMDSEKYKLDEIHLQTYEEVMPIICVVKDGKMGAIDYEGDMIIDPIYEKLEMDVNHVPNVVYAYDGENWSVIWLGKSKRPINFVIPDWILGNYRL